MRKFSRQYCSLKFIEATVACALYRYVIFGIPAILAQQPYPCSDALVTCDNHPGISERAKVFGRIKTEGSSVSEAASSLSSSSRSMCLSAIFDQGNAVPITKRPDLFHIAQQAVQMGCDDSVDMLSHIAQ
jgi:hypothetical protein